jgi:hypothetical protein
MLLDSEYRSAAFVTERNHCVHKDGSESPREQHSTIFPETYSVSGDQITFEGDLGVARAVLKGDILIYKSGEEDQSTDFLFRRE